MNRKQFLILLVVVVILGAFGWMHYRNNESSWRSGSAAGQKLLGDLPINDIASIRIRGGTNELDVVKKDGTWRVAQRQDYPANYGEISSFLLKAADLKAAQVEEIDSSMLTRYKLLPPGISTNTAVQVDLFNNTGKAVGTLLLGKTHLRKGQGQRGPMGMPGGEDGYPDGRYVMTSPDSKTVAVISEPFSDFGAFPERWLSKDFFKVEKIRSIEVTYPEATNSWKLTRDNETGNDWKLANAKSTEQLDPTKLSSFSYALSSPTFGDVLPADARPELAGLDKPTVITLNTFDNFTYTIKVGQKTNDNLPVIVTVSADLAKERTLGKEEKAEDKARLDKEFADHQKVLEQKLIKEKAFDKWIYMVTSWTLESLLKERGQLLTEKKEEPAAETNSKSTHPVPAIPSITPGNP